MEVILREHVDNLGRRGDVVKVASGYARNYLLPRKLALAVTENNKRQIERERKLAEARDAEERAGAESASSARRRSTTSTTRTSGCWRRSSRSAARSSRGAFPARARCTSASCRSRSNAPVSWRSFRT